MALKAMMLSVFWVLNVLVASSRAQSALADGKYCELRSDPCCRGRMDDCGYPIRGTVCYCDDFCLRSPNDDCCPDYWTICRNQPAPPTPPPSPLQMRCYFQGRAYDENSSIRLNCNTCTCRAVSPTIFQMTCDDNTCLVRPELIDHINRADYGWQASNYSDFWGKTLTEGVTSYLGSCQPQNQVLSQRTVRVHNDGHPLQNEFDSRERWPGYIQPIRDQGPFPSSWAISTADLAADRLAIQSQGRQRSQLSAQQLISCDIRRQSSCQSGYTDRAWHYLFTFGLVSEECYRYESGTTRQKGTCSISRSIQRLYARCPSTGTNGRIYSSPPSYRLSSDENAIMREIQSNGPVQAILRLREDFFVYKAGVYRYSDASIITAVDGHQHGYHAVRIIGWGTDYSQRRPVKYWTCANSWGTNWGENGYFRIVRGENESEVESFIVAVWAKPTSTNDLIDNELPDPVRSSQ